LKIGRPFYLPSPRGPDREAILQRNTDEIMCHIAVMLPESYRGVYSDHPRLKELI
jgi:1-acyl-sn-glycerol-3-phosphate acyltransferase